MPASQAPPAPKAPASVTPRSGLSGDIAQRLEQDVLLGRIRPGERLDERDLSDRYGVSRTPVREALAASGGRRLGRGPWPPGLTGDTIVSVGLAGRADGGRRTRGACGRPGVPAHPARAARDAAGGPRRRAPWVFAAGDHDAFYDANIEFHRGIAEGSQNAILQEELRRLCFKLRDTGAPSPSSPAAWRRRSRARCRARRHPSGRRTSRKRLDAEPPLHVGRRDRRLPALRPGVRARRPVYRMTDRAGFGPGVRHRRTVWTGWLGDLDSNQGFPSQSRKFYR